MTSALRDPTFFTLVDEFLRRRRLNDTYSVEAFAEEFPHMRESILQEFPGLILAESLRKQEVAIEIPKNLGRYKVGQEIGRGAMGIVVSATNPGLDSEVAIKLLSFERIRSIAMLQRFHAEAKTCAAMEHPNIVPVFDYGTDEKFAYLVMRRVRGKSLDKVIAGLAKHPVPTESGGIQMDWGLVTSIGTQAADAIHYAHEQGVIHRDIKPANLILGKEGKVWVSDFGLSKVLSNDANLSTSGDVIGTPRYMAPEQIRGFCDVRSDVYSLGLTLFELASGQTVWDSLNGTQLLRKRSALELPDLKQINPAVPDALSEIIMRAVQLRPENRFASAGELSSALKRTVHGSVVADRRSRDRSFARPMRYSHILLAACLGIVTPVCVFLFSPGQDANLADALQQPETVRGILEKEESRQIIADQLPQLIETAMNTDDRALRVAVAGFANRVITTSVEQSDASEEDKAELLLGYRRMQEAYTESGLDGPDFAAAMLVQEEEFATSVMKAQKASAAERFERLRLSLPSIGLSAEEEDQARRQIARYQAAVANESLLLPEQVTINRMLSSLPTVESDSSGSTRLSIDSARFFTSYLRTQLDKANIPAETSASVAPATRTNQNTSVSEPPQEID